VSHTRWLEKNSGQYVRLYTSSYFPANLHLHSETHFCCEPILLYRSFCYKNQSNIDLDSKHWQLSSSRNNSLIVFTDCIFLISISTSVKKVKRIYVVWVTIY